MESILIHQAYCENRHLGEDNFLGETESHFIGLGRTELLDFSKEQKKRDYLVVL